MSSADLKGRRGALLVALALSIAVGACNVRPLYGTTPGGAQVDAELSSIAIPPAEGRLGQIVRNELIFAFNGGQPAQNAIYRLDLDIEASESEPVVRQISSEPQSRLLNVWASFELFRQGETAPIFKSSVNRQATYQWTNQRFANDRAEIDARQRAAKETAEEIRLRLATFFASDQSIVGVNSPKLSEKDEDTLFDRANNATFGTGVSSDPD